MSNCPSDSYQASVTPGPVGVLFSHWLVPQWAPPLSNQLSVSDHSANSCPSVLLRLKCGIRQILEFYMGSSGSPALGQQMSWQPREEVKCSIPQGSRALAKFSQ